MIDSGQDERDTDGVGPGHDDAALRLGRHAVGLLQAARDLGDLGLVAQAEAVAMAVGFALAARLSDQDETAED
ncbi:hypothetical protein [Methylobacterium sp. NEAU K]|uniref:hypothetical protein n=1 Tax=Methylobacterium sp. NEAU K TaxID=3064946 RepID=UPI0027340D8E|nr:hypothetical protein [Methylobacterium sp. NEAU K]MDP4004736.1 hypothetical protein [Methylobacterium sp. NEAU K]